MVIKSALRHVPSFHAAPKRCRILLRVHRPGPPRYSSDIAQLREEMLSRPHQYITDYITPTQSASLTQALDGFLQFPSKANPPRQAHPLPRSFDYGTLDPTHHLVYFSKVEPSRQLLPDGTDSWDSPGAPFRRRLWAGGNMSFNRDIPMDGRPFDCLEFINEVSIRGQGEKEKLYVAIKRCVFPGRFLGESKRQPKQEVEDGVRNTSYVTETRVLAFTRDDETERGSPAASPNLAFQPGMKADYSCTMVPTRELLFRFSALTLNAHAIHLDKSYCREIEGHRNLLVQGPLTLVLMIQVLREYLRLQTHGPKPENLVAIEYRNMGPLYVDEEMRIYVKKRLDRDSKGITLWGVWIYGPDSRYAVRALVKTAVASPPAWRPAEGDLPLDEESIPLEDIAFQKLSTSLSHMRTEGDYRVRGKRGRK